MAEVRADRQILMYGLFVSVGLIFLVRLFYVQVLDDSYRVAADDNALRRVVLHPHRGLIYDRKGELIVYNEPIYDLMAVPREIKIRDTVKFCSLLNITKEDFEKRIQKARYRPAEPFKAQMSKNEYAKLQNYLSDFQGFYVTQRTVRTYPHLSMANALGYISEVDEVQLKQDSTKYYEKGDFIGKSGIEASYEKYLRGQKGINFQMRDKHNQNKGTFQDGQKDKPAVAGESLTTGIDLSLQEYGEKLMANKAGAVIAIEPATGEILSVISAPNYNPNLLTGTMLSRNFNALNKDIEKPLFNRAIQSRYPPGSTFKTAQALIALQEGVLSDSVQYFPCNQMLVKCHGHPSVNISGSIQYSCNPYYYQVFRRVMYRGREETFATLSLNYDIWRKYMLRFGFGQKLGIDIANENSGSIPKTTFFDKAYGKGNWKYSNIYSLSIGQGEVGVTPVQLANLTATIANRGFFYTPHIVKAIGSTGKPLPQYTVKHETGIDKKYYEEIIEGMEWAYKSGTVGPYAKTRGVDLHICGKTGTVQNPQGDDHSTFIAFAPRDNPKIAMMVYVENAGFGGIWAATVASLMIEKYLTDTIKRPDIEKMTMEKAFSLKILLRRDSAWKAEKARMDSIVKVKAEEEKEDRKNFPEKYKRRQDSLLKVQEEKLKKLQPAKPKEEEDVMPDA